MLHDSSRNADNELLDSNLRCISAKLNALLNCSEDNNCMDTKNNIPSKNVGGNSSTSITYEHQFPLNTWYGYTYLSMEGSSFDKHFTNLMNKSKNPYFDSGVPMPSRLLSKEKLGNHPQTYHKGQKKVKPMKDKANIDLMILDNPDFLQRPVVRVLEFFRQLHLYVFDSLDPINDDSVMQMMRASLPRTQNIQIHLECAFWICSQFLRKKRYAIQNGEIHNKIVYGDCMDSCSKLYVKLAELNAFRQLELQCNKGYWTPNSKENGDKLESFLPLLSCQIRECNIKVTLYIFDQQQTYMNKELRDQQIVHIAQIGENHFESPMLSEIGQEVRKREWDEEVLHGKFYSVSYGDNEGVGMNVLASNVLGIKCNTQFMRFIGSKKL